MMGRGPEGGCGTEERACRIYSRTSASAKADDREPETSEDERSAPLIDYFAQARKSLSDVSPFDIPEDGAGPSVASYYTLPNSLASILRHFDGRKKQKKSHGSVEKRASRPNDRSKSKNVWIETEDYFRDLSLADIDTLFGVSTSQRVPCWVKNFLIPVTGSLITTNTDSTGNAEIDPMKIINPTERERLSDDKNSVEFECNAIQTVSELPTQDSSNVVWLAGCRTRKLWTLEKYKKRKLVTLENGLEKILVGTPCQGNFLCDFCCRGELSYPIINEMIMCCSCKVTVHRRCYGISGTVDGSHWLCSWCKKSSESVSDKQLCAICSKKGGALKPFDNGENGRSVALFAHLFCSLWLPELYVENIDIMEPIKCVGDFKETRKLLLCSICKVKCGTCIQCCHAPCRATFHPICAREGRNKMEIWGNYRCGIVSLRAFCAKHSQCTDEVDMVQLEDPVPGNRSRSPCQENQNGESIISSELKSDNLGGVELQDVDYNVAVGDTKLDPDGNNLEQTICNTPFEETGSEDATPTRSLNLSLMLKKLIDKGTINIKDLALESGITSELLSTALAENNIGIDLASKLFTCLKKHAHLVPLRRKTRSNTGSLCNYYLIGLDGDKTEQFSVKDMDIDCCTANQRISKEPVREPYFYSSLEKCGFEVHENSNPGHEGLAVSTGSHFCSDSVKDDLDPKNGINSYYIHPLILEKLMHVEDSSSLVCSDIQLQGCGIDNSCIEASSISSISCKQGNGHSMCSEVGDEGEDIKAKKVKLLQMSPSNDVEGELIYYQNRLLDITMNRKCLTDKLIYNVAKNLPLEIDVIRTQRWDMVLLNHYLTSVREAKKQSRKERKHREAQAVLAAATAAAAASARNTSLRKESLEEASHSEQYSKFSGRVGSSVHLFSRPKETQSKIAVSRGYNEKYSDILQLGSEISKENTKACDVCRRIETIFNPILVCSNCKASVHLDCYRSVSESTGPWLCEVCEELASLQSSNNAASNFWEKPYFVAECSICGGTKGAFRKTSNNLWIHAFCAEWVLESTFRRGQVNPVEGMETALKDVDTCCVCLRKFGICLKCSYGHCHTSFHPWCGRSAGFYMNVKIIGGKYQHKSYCEKHSAEQRLKAESQKHGTEDLRNMKQIRVELERLRLLCDRIVKREKLKRDLVVCSHGILACKRDHVARSLLSHGPGPFFPDASSDSATTSHRENNDGFRSMNDAVQRSDDVTVDSNLSTKQTDHRTEDSSTSQTLDQKPVERLQHGGKQIPRRPSFPQSQLDDGE